MEVSNLPEQDFNASDSSPEGRDNETGIALKEKYQRLFQRGLRWLGAGVVLMAISFAVNFFLFQADKSFITIMYVMTTAGAVCIVKGLADILGF